MKIKLLSILIENFKGIVRHEFNTDSMLVIFKGKNASGKTTIFDAVKFLLFDEDSHGNSNFSARPKDENGEDVNNVEIKVKGTLLVDGETVVLAKIQRQKWTKKRGHSERVFEGNENLFEIDNYPVKKTEYTARVSSIIEKSLFQLMTDPMAFANLPWKEQRQMLVKFVSDITDADILALDEATFEPIKSEVLAVGVDKVREKYNATQKKLKEEQATYPIRIDEASRNISDGEEDRSKLIWQKGEAEEELNVIQNERNGLSKASKVVTDIQNEIIQKRRRMAEIERSAMLQDEKKNLEATRAVNAALMDIRKAESERDALANKRAFLMAAIKENKDAKAALKDRFIATKKEQFPENKTICPKCGRPFETSRIAEIKAEWKKKNDADIEALNEKGFALKDKIIADEKQLETIEQQIAGYTADIAGVNQKWESLRVEAEKPARTDPKTIPEYQELQAGIDELDRKLASLEDQSAIREELDNREAAARAKIDAVNTALAKIESNNRLMERIEQLKAEQRECSQKIADCERIIYLLEEFTQLKMNTLSDRINSHFEKVRFKLFEKLINGSVKETCQMQICTNGSYVDYASANRSGQIIGGIDVIHALQELNQISAPIWIDNAECFSQDNIPTSDSQMILLTVSDDEKLVMERR